MVALHGEPLLVLGGSGFLGRVLSARLLADTPCPLVLPVRDRHDPVDVQASIAAEHANLTLQTVQERTRIVRLPARLTDLAPTCRNAGVRGVIHSAGSVSYFDRAALTAGNEDLTRGALALGASLNVEHFTYVSTAFSCGYTTGPVRETLHAEPEADPTDYTASKRACEHLVAASGLPWLIARPSIVIGDSRTGRYSGRPYGVYQLWRGFERLLSHEWQEVAHAVASEGRLQLVHQDAVADGMLAALRRFESGRILHLVSDPTHLPTVRQAWQLWFEHMVRPREVVFHASTSAAASHAMTKRQRVYLDFTTTNLEIAGRDWDFRTDGLRDLGCEPAKADRTSLLRCQAAYVSRSPALRAYLAAVAA